jgi:5-oxopent-3-ene-1,2,5-tricarboxylate decarboxylase/2-hydroxyhepta-2,4-diene-1,7-dioate isomerase
MRGSVAQTGDIPAPHAVYGVLLNFKNELTALGEAVNRPPYKAPPKAPVLYVKPANTWAADGAPIPLPAGETALQPGASLGIVFGRAAVRLTEHNALDPVVGFTVINDVRLPHTSFYRPALKQLCRDGFCVVGSRVVPRSQVADPGSLRLRSYVNGELRQEASTADLVRSIPRLLADITSFMTLGPGDILMIGVAADRPLASAGDRVRVEVQGIGSVENAVVSEARLTGAPA